ncbi:hypothetical protein PHYPSEUDO_004251 [Phytophthora pseudosyringae]|uniref:WLGC domain-containing protein n=1 Tax=Phytophthora pseudosyringae TaxID=221518 RepID=A0A8T1VPP5_9STRA|nr:hypothetical protein PHYPSEUDO_004251 [Phytophthora pseudosyringae]
MVFAEPKRRGEGLPSSNSTWHIGIAPASVSSCRMVQLFSRGWKVVQGPPTAVVRQDTKRDPTTTEPAIPVRESWWRWRQRRFSAIGWGYVILLVVIFSLSSAWSLLLIILNLAPDKSANYILQTGRLDHGHFWQSCKVPLSIQITTTTLLIVVVGVYWYLLYLLLIRPPPWRVRLSKRQATKTVAQGQATRSALVREMYQLMIKFFHTVISTDGKFRKAWNVLMEIPEVILQILNLRELMTQGLDPSLLYCYASLMALNAFVVFYHMQFRWNEAALHHILKDSVLDAACGVFFPALILFYSLFIFQDDLKAVKIRQQFFPPRVFERKARNYVSAKELNMFNTDFEMYGAGCIVYTAIAVQVSRDSCSSYPQCVQFSHQWVIDSQELMDVTQTLAKLAAAGKLQTVQLVNNKINGSLPDELQMCQGLRNLVLIHTGVEVFPSWASASFSKLEYLHIEGDSSDINLTELPSDLFALMTSLHTIHLSYHASLPSLPSMVGLVSLESAYFGYLDLLTELPSMGDLRAIQVLALEGLPQVRTLPDIEQYEDTLEMVFVQDSPACCSGFLHGGDCNTTFRNCCGRHHQVDDSSDSSNDDDPLPSTCLAMPDESVLLPTNTTLSVLAHYAGNLSNFCDPAQATCPSVFMAKSIWIQEDACAGVLYRECSSEYQGAGICFNEDMGRVQCVYSQTTIAMRKAEIVAGCSCDKIEEKWLGCT